MGQTLMGWYVIPTTVDRPLNLVVNPRGEEERSRLAVWNAGDNRRKVITLADKAPKSRRSAQLKAGGGVSQGALWADGSGNLTKGAHLTPSTCPCLSQKHHNVHYLLRARGTCPHCASALLANGMWKDLRQCLTLHYSLQCQEGRAQGFASG